MTTREFFAKHYGSLSIALFGIVVLTAIAAFGGHIGALTSLKPAKPDAAAAETAGHESEQALPNPESPPSPVEAAASTENASEQPPADEAAQREKEEEEERAALTAGADTTGVDPTPEDVSPPEPSKQEEPAPASSE